MSSSDTHFSYNYSLTMMPSWTLLIKKTEWGVVVHVSNSSTRAAEWRRLLAVSVQMTCAQWVPGQTELQSKPVTNQRFLWSVGACP